MHHRRGPPTRRAPGVRFRSPRSRHPAVRRRCGPPDASRRWPRPGARDCNPPRPSAPRTAQDFAPERVIGTHQGPPGNPRRPPHRPDDLLRADHLGPNRSERRERELIATAGNPISACRRVAIVSRKGGIGKTTTTLMLGHTFATHRMDRVVALDANPDAGSLAYRVRRETEATVTRCCAHRSGSGGTATCADFTSQSPTRLEILALRRRPHHQRGPGRAGVPPGATRAGAPLQPDPDGHGYRHPPTRQPRVCCGWPTRSWSAPPRHRRLARLEPHPRLARRARLPRPGDRRRGGHQPGAQESGSRARGRSPSTSPSAAARWSTCPGTPTSPRASRWTSTICVRRRASPTSTWPAPWRELTLPSRRR